MFTPNFNFWDDYCINRNKNAITHWNGPDTEETLKKVRENKKFVTYNAGDYFYKNNSLGFRSEEFDNSDKIKILYGGCSMTEGIGVPLEHTWASFTNSLISVEVGKPVKLYNIGIGGSSIDAIVRFTYLTIKNEKFVPDLVLLLLPSISRSEVFYQDLSSRIKIYNFISTFDKYDDPQIRAIHEALLKNYSPAQRVHDTFKNLLMLKEFLDARSIPFYFQTWDNTKILFNKGFALEFSDILSEHSPKDLKPHAIRAKMKFDLSRFPPRFGLPFKQNIGRDGMHPGPNTHWDYANEMLEWLRTQEAFRELLTKWKNNGN